MKGIDVSEWQHSLNLTAATEVEFVYIKATEGLHTIDKHAISHMLECQKANKPYGFYHFFHPEENNAAQQANFFNYITTTVLTGGSCLPAIDVEINRTNISKEDMEVQIRTFITTYNNNMMIYSSPGFLNSNLPLFHSLGKYPLWIAEYTNLHQPKIPNGWSNYAIWQYTDKLNIPENQFDFDGDICPDYTLITN